MITSTSNGQIKKIQQLLKKIQDKKRRGAFRGGRDQDVREAPPERIEKIYLGASFAGKGTWREILRKRVWKKKRKSDGSRGGQSV